MVRISIIVVAVLFGVQLNAQVPATAIKPMNLNCTLDGSGYANFCVQNAKSGRLVVEIALWNRWVVFDTLGTLREGQDTCISANYQLHTGLNQVRFFIDDGNKSTYDIKSSTAKYAVTDTTYDCSNLPPSGLDDINLKRDTYWEIYTERGGFVKRGTSSKIVKSGLAAGKYILYFENCSMEFVVL